MKDNQSNQALICGFCVNQDGSVQNLQWEDLLAQPEPQAEQLRWIHLNREVSDVQSWLRFHQNIDELVANALLQEDTRPRIVAHHDGYLLNLRGVNLNPGQDPEDMISLRIWATPGQVITTRARRVMATEDLRDRFLAGDPPRTTGSLIAFLTQRLVARIGPVVADLDEQVDALEEQILTDTRQTSKANIGRFRRTVLNLRRYIAPQREALAGFIRDGESILNDTERYQLRDTHDVVVRLAEDLDLIRERALFLQEQLVEERAEAMNERLFVLAIISAIFLPLGFVTGLFGVNVGGVPGVDHPLAFTLLCAAMLLFSVGIVIAFRRMKWI
jgi:zinc transporter